MKNFNFKSLLPHIIAVVVFLIIAVIFCKPGLDSSLILKQQDITGWKGMSQQAMEYKEMHGHFPLWLSNMFSGMPAYQVALEGAWSPLGLIDRTFQLWLPQPMNFFFLACISFYFMCICFRIRSYAAIAAALGFAYCSFSPIIITAGHNSQMMALAYAPSVIGAVVLIFRKYYLSGFTLTALLTALQIGQGHQQISFYLFIILCAFTINYIINAIKEKSTVHVAKSIGFMAIAAILAVSVNAITLWTTYEYAKDSKRGGQLVMDGSKKDASADGKTKGLSKEYAFQWSYGKTETFSLMFPGVMGYGMHYAERDGEPYMFPQLKENAHVVNYFTEKFPAVSADQIVSYMSQQLYWGDQPFTNGPVYLGAVICFLFIIGLFMLDNENKWWILATVILAILLSWGKNFPGFNNFIFDNIPLYNKFRVPTMTLVIPQILAPLLAAMALNKIANNNDPEIWKKYKFGLYATGVVFILGLFTYMNADFGRENKARTKKFNDIYQSGGGDVADKLSALNATDEPFKDNRLYEETVGNFKGNPDALKMSREVVAEVRKDRAELFGGDILRSFIFVMIAAILLGIFIRKMVPENVMLIGAALLIAVDLLSFGVKYLNDKSFDSKDKYESSEFPMSPADEQIKKDADPNFRVFNLAGGDPFQESKTSYYHKSIGGYHPAKIGIYDDLASYQLSGSTNIAVLNMLNTKYVLQRQGNDVVASMNPGALGNCWFVKGIKTVNGAVEEMKALNNFNPKDTAVIDQKFASDLKDIVAADSSASIKMTNFDNDAISYQSASSAKHLAVFSEIYYKDWKATIDGQPATMLKANYVLRALVIPAGNHKIEFKFEPRSYYTGRTISNIASWLVTILLLLTIFMQFRNNKNNVKSL